MVDFSRFFAAPGRIRDEIAAEEARVLPVSDLSGDVNTSLADVALGGPANVPDKVRNIDQLIETRTPEALSLLEGGSQEAVRLSQLAQRAGTDPLQQFAGLGAFNEQQALLGTSGAAAQEQAIGNIPVSQFDRELQRRQTIGQQRQASAAGERGSGASLLGAQQLAGAQQADVIQTRLQQLQPLAQVSRGARTAISGIDEASRLRQADLQGQLGTQQAAIRFGTTAPLIESRLSQAELGGLQRIASADQRGEIAGQLASIAGRFVPQQQTTTQPPQPTFETSIPEAGSVRVG